MAQVLIYINDKRKAVQIESVCRRIGIEVKPIQANEFDKSLGSLTGMAVMAGNPKVKMPVFYQQPDIIIFHGLSDSMLDQFLTEYRKDKIEPTPVKAVVTMHNLSWSVYELTQELLKEVNSMKKYSK